MHFFVFCFFRFLPSLTVPPGEKSSFQRERTERNLKPTVPRRRGSRCERPPATSPPGGPCGRGGRLRRAEDRTISRSLNVAHEQQRANREEILTEVTSPPDCSRGQTPRWKWKNETAAPGWFGSFRYIKIKKLWSSSNGLNINEVLVKWAKSNLAPYDLWTWFLKRPICAAPMA